MFGIGVPGTPNWKNKFLWCLLWFLCRRVPERDLGSVDLGAATPVRTAGEFMFAPTRKTVLLVFVQSERESLCHEAGQQTPLGIFHLCFSLECGLRPQSVQGCSKCHSWGTVPLHLKASPCLPTGTVWICLQESQMSWKTRRYSKMDVDEPQ